MRSIPVMSIAVVAILGCPIVEHGRVLLTEEIRIKDASCLNPVSHLLYNNGF